MRILIVTQYFWPENFKINELCSEFVKLGHEVTVLTGKPNYPNGRFFKGYGFFSKIYDSYNGAKIIRLPIISRGKGLDLRLFLNYLSFTFFGSFFMLFHRKKYDFSFVFGVSPITQAFPAIIHKYFYKTKMLLWVQDLWPESVEITKRLNSSIINKFLKYTVIVIYNSSDKIFISSRFMEDSVREKFKHQNKTDIIYLPNWAEEIFTKKSVEFDKFISLIPKGFVVMFAGNIGSGQDLQSIVKTAQLLQSQMVVKFVIIGDGSDKEYVENQIKELNLEDTIYLLGSYPIEEMPNFYCHADVMLVTLRDEDIYSYTVPSKLQSYMASSKAILGMINGEAAKIISDSRCGKAVNAEDFKALGELIKNFSNLPKEELAQMGRNGFVYSIENFSKNYIVKKIFNEINMIN